MNPDSQTHLEPIFSLVEPLVEAAGHDLYDIHQNGGTLAVLVDSEEGLGVDDLSGLSRSLSAALDEHDPIPGRYTLEISTPGVERRLRQEKHFVGAVEDGVLTIETSDLDASKVPLTEIEKARTVFEWGPAPKPGSSGKKNGSNNNHKGGSRR